MKIKKIPTRKCCGCGENKPKRELLRIVKNKDGEIFTDITGKLNGRGVYLCKNVDCYSKAKKLHSMENSLKCKIDDETYEDILKIITDNDNK